MIILIGSKGNSLGAQIYEKLKNHHSNELFVSTDIDDFDASDYYETERFFTGIDKSASSAQMGAKSYYDNIKVVSFVGTMHNARIPDETPENFERLMHINAGSLFNISKCLYPIFEQHEGGRLIHIGSNSAIQGFSGMMSYCASKFATHGMIQVIAKEYAKIGAVANQINPCAFEPGSSDMSNAQVQGFMSTQKMTHDEVIKMMTSRIPAGRLANIDDLYSMIDFLLFDSTDFVTGQAFNLSGGMMM